MALKNKKFTFVDMDKTLLSLDHARECYFTFDQEELGECKFLEPKLLTCKQNHLLL